MTLREVVLEVIKRPLVLVKLRPLEVVGDRLPAVLPEPTVSHLLKVLRTATSLRRGLVPARRQAFAVQRNLIDALELRRHLDARGVEHCWCDVDGMAEGVADRVAVPNAGWPVDDQRMPDAPAVGVLLVPAEGRVAGLRPAPRDVGVRMRSADVVKAVGDNVIDVLRDEVEEAELVHYAVRAALLASAIIRAEHEQRVVEKALLLEERDEPADLSVCVVEESGERLLQSRGEDLVALRELGPGENAGVARSERGPARDDA